MKFPKWFFYAYPDVTVWYVKNDIKSKMSMQNIDSVYLRKIVDGFKNEYSKLEVID